MTGPKVLENIAAMAERLDRVTLSSADQMGLRAALDYGIGLKVSPTKRICSCEVAAGCFHSRTVTGRQNERRTISLVTTVEIGFPEHRQVLSRTSSFDDLKQLILHRSK